MSGHDLYLVLRERLEAVADTIHIDSEILHDAQSAKGFSNERIAREARWSSSRSRAISSSSQTEEGCELIMDLSTPGPVAAAGTSDPKPWSGQTRRNPA